MPPHTVDSRGGSDLPERFLSRSPSWERIARKRPGNSGLTGRRSDVPATRCREHARSPPFGLQDRIEEGSDPPVPVRSDGLCGSEVHLISFSPGKSGKAQRFDLRDWLARAVVFTLGIATLLTLVVIPICYGLAYSGADHRPHAGGQHAPLQTVLHAGKEGRKGRETRNLPRRPESPARDPLTGGDRRGRIQMWNLARELRIAPIAMLADQCGTWPVAGVSLVVVQLPQLAPFSTGANHADQTPRF